MIQPNLQLWNEVCELYAANPDVSALALFGMLNHPERIRERGYAVMETHLIQAIVSRYRTNDDTRYVLYDYDSDELATSNVYTDREEAGSDADDLRGCGTVCVLRLDI